MTLNSRQFAIRAGLFVTTTAYAMLFTATGVQAQQSQASDGSTQNDIVVIGTRRTDRTATNSASPVDIISAKTLSNQPSANIIDAINNIVPSFYVGQNSISDASTFVRSPSLRGLPGDETLVML
ncbi:MAG: TonB-dependent receptor plug domain-containing protein, partial [Alphaproteobacteria bacterium]|nr:TonB-dependent receptor plug domain-containing protein [Alphaproteobacteria bacterium]